MFLNHFLLVSPLGKGVALHLNFLYPNLVEIETGVIEKKNM